MVIFMQNTIENYMKDIHTIPETLEIESKSFIQTFSMQLLKDIKEYMAKNKMVCNEEKIDN